MERALGCGSVEDGVTSARAVFMKRLESLLHVPVIKKQTGGSRIKISWILSATLARIFVFQGWKQVGGWKVRGALKEWRSVCLFAGFI